MCVCINDKITQNVTQNKLKTLVEVNLYDAADADRKGVAINEWENMKEFALDSLHSFQIRAFGPSFDDCQ